MAEESGKKRSKKSVFAMLLAGAGAIAMMMKRKKRATQDSGWEEAKPDVG